MDEALGEEGHVALVEVVDDGTLAAVFLHERYPELVALDRVKHLHSWNDEEEGKGGQRQIYLQPKRFEQWGQDACRRTPSRRSGCFANLSERVISNPEPVLALLSLCSRHKLSIAAVAIRSPIES